MISKKGFTLLETVLFLALSGALVAALIAGTSRSISQKRYTDTVDNFVDYLQGLYSDVNYVQGNNGISGGNTGKAIYGKLIVSNNGRSFDEYTVVGKATCSSNKGGIEAINDCVPSLLPETKKTYKLSWGGTAEEANGKKIAILIFTHPSTGMKTTLLKKSDSEFTINDSDEKPASLFDSSKFLNDFISDDINFCLLSDDASSAGYTSTSHKLIRIHSGANNASGVEIISDDARGGSCGG